MIKKLLWKISDENLTYLKIYSKVLALFLFLFFILAIGLNYYILHLEVQIAINFTNTQIVSFLLLVSILPFISSLLYAYFLLRKNEKTKKYITFKYLFSKFNPKIIIISILSILWISFIFEHFLIQQHQSNIVTDILSNWNTLSLILFWFFAVLMAIMEELIYRWILFWFIETFLKSKINRKKAVFITIVITALLFWLSHLQYSWTLIIEVITIWLMLWYIRYKYWMINNIIIHVINNFIIVLTSIIIPLLFINNVHNNKLLNSFKNEKNFILEKITKNAINPYIYKYKKLLINNKDKIKNMNDKEYNDLLKKITTLQTRFNNYNNNLKLSKRDKEEIKDFLNNLEIQIKFLKIIRNK